MYTVRFRGKNSANQFSELLKFQDWKPSVGDEFECQELEAIERFRILVQDGRAPRSVDGLVPWIVEIVEPREGARERVMVSITCGTIEQGRKDLDKPVGPWAKKAALALERKLAA